MVGIYIPFNALGKLAGISIDNILLFPDGQHIQCSPSRSSHRQGRIVPMSIQSTNAAVPDVERPWRKVSRMAKAVADNAGGDQQPHWCGMAGFPRKGFEATTRTCCIGGRDRASLRADAVSRRSSRRLWRCSNGGFSPRSARPSSMPIGPTSVTSRAPMRSNGRPCCMS